MSQFVRTLGVVLVAAALLDASAGLCFCHLGPVGPGPAPASHGCCHGSDTPGTTTLKPAGTCCHVEAAAHQATPAVDAQFAPPGSRAVPVSELSAAAAIPALAPVRPAPSPPLVALRI